MTLVERLAAELRERGVDAMLSGRDLVVSGTRFSARETARLAIQVYAEPPVVVAPRLHRPAWTDYELLDEFLDWAEQHEFSDDELSLYDRLVSGAVDPVEAQSWAALNGWHEFTRAAGELADRWLERGAR